MGGGNAAGSLAGAVSVGVSLGAAVTVALSLGSETADCSVADPSTSAAETGGVGRRVRPGVGSATLGLADTSLGNELLLIGALSGTGGLGRVEDLAGGAGALSADERLEAGTALGSALVPGVASSAPVDAGSVGPDHLRGVGTLAGAGLGRVFDLTVGAADGLVTGQTRGTAELVAQDLAVGARTGSVTLTVGSTPAGSGAAQSVDLGGTSRATGSV